MSIVTAPVKKEENKTASETAQKSIENHKMAAKHHTDAAKHHTEAAKHHEDGSHEKAAVSTVKAQGSAQMACDHMAENAKQHAVGSN